MAMKNDYNECLSDAIRHIKARNIGDALNKLFTAQKLQPDNPRAFTLAGTAYQLAGNYNEAEHYYSKALALDKNNGARYFELANAQYALMRYSEAIANYAKAEQLKCPDDMMYEIYYIMGVYNQFVSDSKDKFAKNQSALLNYNKAEEISSCSKHKRDILTYKIQIFFESGDYDNATSCALQLKYLSPQEFNTYKLLSQLMLIQGKVSEAEMYLNEADKNCPNFAQMQILVERINVLEIKAEISAETDSRYYDQAISLCDLVIESHAVPLAVTYHVTMKKASIMLKNKDFDGAIKTCTEIANEDKSDVMSEIEKARFILVECYVSKKNFSEALRYAKLLKQSSNLDCQQHGYYTEALCEKELGNHDYVKIYERATAFFKNCMITNPGDQLAIRYRMKTYLDLGKFQQAREMAELFPPQEKEELLDYINNNYK